MGYSFRESGVPSVDAERCKGCGLCVRTCPEEVLVMEDGRPRAAAGTFLGCIACGQCMAVCPTGGITVSGRGLRPDDRIELPPRDRQATLEQFEALAVARRSVRRFKPEDVPRDLLEQVVRVASTAPMGIPPSDVGVVVFSRREQVRAFAEDACACFEKAGKFFHPIVLGLMRPFIGKSQYEMFRDFIRPLLRLLPEMWKQGRDKFTYDAPALMLFHHGPMTDATDCTIAATYAMLAAETMGLGSCMLGTTVALSNDKRLKAKYGIPPENKVGVALALGYPDVHFHHAIRRRLASVHFAE